jgi:hypothetical protein
MEASVTAAIKMKLLAMSIMAVLGLGVVVVTLSVAGYHGITVGSTFSLASSLVNPANIRMPY